MRSFSNKFKIKKDFNLWLKKTLIDNDGLVSLFIRPRIECNDGFSMSVQGGDFSYSTPRRVGDSFTEMEIGFPSEPEDLILGYAESNEPTNTVYPYVPVELILKVIEKHGGMKKNKKKF